MATCDECIFLPSATIWESESRIKGELGQNKSPFDANMAWSYQNRNQEHPIAGITKEECQNCSVCNLRAHEAFFNNNKIIFEEISMKKIRLKRTVGNRPSPMLLHKNNYTMGHSREKYNFHDEPEEVKEATLFLLKKLFSVPGFLSPQQAEIFAKVDLGFKLRKSTERNNKRNLRKKIRSCEYIHYYWKDLRKLL